MSQYHRPKEKLPVVYTTKAKCRDCYRCVRVCPVQAIKMKNGQAEVIPELCIACGTCIRACPQNAKNYRTDVNKVLQLLDEGATLALSLAPSFVVYYDDWEQKRLPSAARMLGFNFVAETSVGAWHVAHASAEAIRKNPSRAHLCTACPAAVSFTLRKTPALAPFLIGVASPMIAHARMLKADNPKRKVVFVGPCVAKKEEAQWLENEKMVDAVLTFEEFDEIFQHRGINIRQCEESSFDQPVPGDARLFPLEGGLLRTAGINTDLLDPSIVAVSGYREVNSALEALMEQPKQALIIEPMFCKNGCIGGPFASKSGNVLLDRKRILAYNQTNPGQNDEGLAVNKRIETLFPSGQSKKRGSFTEEQIRQVLAMTGKHSPEDELNCTACGYIGCREKAIAVLEGMAEPEMCVPFMRSMAEKKFDTMIEYDPNGLILLSKELKILHMNPAFKNMFNCSDLLLGRNISYLIDPDPFEKLAAGTETVVRQTIQYKSYNLICHLVAYALPDEDQYAGIFIDVTVSQSSKFQLDEIKTETVLKAQELIDHQIKMAQDLAKFLGEHTAKGEVLMKTLIDSIKK
ncbi:[Fe-Fe] hydrogenase large subunit C-terminal domain-containing protein [Bacteroidales bacterium]